MFRGSLCSHIVQEKEWAKETRGKEAGTWKGCWGKPCLAHSASSTAAEQRFWQTTPVLCVKVCPVPRQEGCTHGERPGCPEILLCRVGPIKGTFIQLPQEKSRPEERKTMEKVKLVARAHFYRMYTVRTTVLPCPCCVTSQAADALWGFRKEEECNGPPQSLLDICLGDHHEEFLIAWSQIPHWNVFLRFRMFLLTSKQGLGILHYLVCCKFRQALGGTGRSP